MPADAALRLDLPADPVVNQAPPPMRRILGVNVVAATAAEAIRHLDDRIGTGRLTKLAFLNAHASNLAARDAAFRDALSRFVVLNDGVGVDIASRVLAGRRFPENLNGTDFVPRFLRESRRRLRVFLLGGRPGVAAAAAATLRRLAPQHDYVGAQHGYFDASETEAVKARIAASRADVLLVAMGNPAQEAWIDAHAAATGAKLAMGVGALFDFLSGRTKRAPEAIRRLKLEWAFRLCLEPSRLWRRYVVGNPRFLGRVAAAALARNAG